MSLSSSSGHKVLESPFSHAQIYGVAHPAAPGGSHKPSGKRRGKASKSKRSGSVAERSGSSTLKKSKKKRIGKGSSAPSVLPATKTHVHKAASFSLAQVDSDPHSPPKKPLKNRSLTNGHFATVSGSISGHLSVNSSSAPANKGRGASRKPEAASTSGKLEAMPTDKRRTPATGTITSLLSFSRMSTSELVLSMCSSPQERGMSAGGGATTTTGGGRGGASWKPKNGRVQGGGAALTLPPHMRVPRQAFATTTATSASNSGSQGGLVGLRRAGGALDVEELGRRLGRMAYRHVIVMSGAGISTPCGIPDFR